MIKPVLFQLALLALLGSASAPAFGQAEPIKFGKPDPKDFDDKNFVADSAAEAVVLCDFGRSRFEVGGPDEGFRTVFERVTRIKILKKAGYENVEVREEKIPVHFTSPEDWWKYGRGSTWGDLVLADMPEDRRNSFKEEHLKEVRRYFDDEGVKTETPVVLVTAKKPE